MNHIETPIHQTRQSQEKLVVTQSTQDLDLLSDEITLEKIMLEDTEEVEHYHKLVDRFQDSLDVLVTKYQNNFTDPQGNALGRLGGEGSYHIKDGITLSRNGHSVQLDSKIGEDNYTLIVESTMEGKVVVMTQEKPDNTIISIQIHLSTDNHNNYLRGREFNRKNLSNYNKDKTVEAINSHTRMREETISYIK